MTKNNYDNCSTMENIEIHCYYDNDLSSHDVENSFKVLQYDGHQHSAIYLFDNCRDIDNLSECYDLSKMTEEQAKFAVLGFYDMKYTTMSNIMNDKSAYDSWKDFLKDTIAGVSIKDEINYHRKFPEYDGAKLLVNIVEVRGYNQGDFARVVYKEEEGFLSDKSKTKKYFEQTLFDTPVYCCIVIDGEDHFLEDVDQYEWDLDDAKANVDKFDISDKAKEWIKNNLPKYPES